MSERTRQEWEVVDSEDRCCDACECTHETNEWFFRFPEESNAVYCEACLGFDEKRAIKRAFRAAPDLIEACEKLMAVFDAGDLESIELDFAVARTREAVDKAKGEA